MACSNAAPLAVLVGSIVGLIVLWIAFKVMD